SFGDRCRLDLAIRIDCWSMSPVEMVQDLLCGFQELVGRGDCPDDIQADIQRLWLDPAPAAGRLGAVSQPDFDSPNASSEVFVRDPFADPSAVLAARRLTMAERFELAVNWNMLASELREGFVRATQQPSPGA
ncbi:MAG TPA: hypothetical protein VI072_21315, partial [Polyangiaceae bacterium]